MRKLRPYALHALLNFLVPLIAIVIAVLVLEGRDRVNAAGSAAGKSLGFPDASNFGSAYRNAILGSRKRVSSARPLDAATELFLPPVIYDPGGSYPEAVVIADLNADGSPDIVVPHANSSTVSVLLSNGHGWFKPPLTYNSGAWMPWSVAVGDVNGDGIPDIVVANDGCGIGVLLGNGDGTFQPTVTYAVCGGWSVVIADLNGDGKPDLAVAVYRNVAVLLGNGDGTFQPAVTYPWGEGDGTGWGSNSMAAADVNGDGKLDLVVATGKNYSRGNSTVAVLLGNGDGTLQAAVDYDAGGSYASSVDVGDVNGDGKPDIVVANHCLTYYCGVLGVLLGRGDGTFQAAVTYSTGGLGGGQPVIADVSSDGKPDVVVVNQCATDRCKTGNMGVLLGNGDGTFQPAAAYATPGKGLAVAVADVNSDGKPDVIVTTPDKVGVLLTRAGIATKTAAITSGSPIYVGQPVTFTATVTASKGMIPDGELMAFYDGITSLGSVKVVSGTAAYTISSLGAKNHGIKAMYVGDGTFRLSRGNVEQVVLKYPTTTLLTSSPNPSNDGQTVTFTAVVTPSGPYAVTGKVKFWDGTTSIGSATLNGGMATLKKSTLALGTHAITAQYLSDSYNDKSISDILYQVVQ